jgi:hypothetical protein
MDAHKFADFCSTIYSKWQVRAFLYLLRLRRPAQFRTDTYFHPQVEKKFAPRCDGIIVVSWHREDEEEKGALFKAFTNMSGELAWARSAIAEHLCTGCISMTVFSLFGRVLPVLLLTRMRNWPRSIQAMNLVSMPQSRDCTPAGCSY